MDDLIALRNFCKNVQPTIIKLKDGAELSDDEKNKIVQFYIETMSYVFGQTVGVAEEAI
jgi:hypothetical protein